MYKKIYKKLKIMIKARLLKAGLINLNQQAVAEGISVIIFSKDRPMQLLACLESYQYYLSNNPKPIILYSASTPAFARAYEELFQKYNHLFHDFCRENNFRIDLLSELKKINTGRIFFLVDDIIFYRHFDLNEILIFNPREEIFSLRLGLNVTFCYTHNLLEKVPVGKIQENYFQWTWNDGELDWCYPLSVDGHIFALDEIIFMLENSEFKAPNSLEVALQAFNYFYLKKKGICYKESILVNNPCNKVQTENNNLYGKLHQGELLEYWNKNLKIDITKVKNKTFNGVHQEFEYNLVSRNT